MITNFEEITKELTDYELNTVVPAVILGLKNKIGKENAISNHKMIIGLKDKLNIKISQPRVRKIIQYIRITGKIERLMATSKGYYICNIEDELRDYIESLMQRANSIERIANQLEFQTNKFINNTNKP